MKNIQKIGCLFDLDGVLIDSEIGYTEIWKRINKEFPTGETELERVIKGCTLEKILNDYFPDKTIAPKVTNRLYELEAEMAYEYKTGAFELLKILKSRNIPRVLVTSSNDKKMKHLYEELPEIHGMFDYIITADMITRSKPDPEGYLLGAKKIGVEPARCIVFEDSLQGVKAGKNAGSLVVGVVGTLPEETIAPYSDILVNSLDQLDLVSLIHKLENNGK